MSAGTYKRKIFKVAIAACPFASPQPLQPPLYLPQALSPTSTSAPGPFALALAQPTDP